MPSPLPRQVQWSLFARASPLSAAFPCVTVRSAPAIIFSGPAQRSLALRPARSPSHQRDPLHRKLRRLRYLRRRFDCYRVERTSSRVGVAPTEVQRLSRRTVTPTILAALSLVAGSTRVVVPLPRCPKAKKKQTRQ